MKSLFVQALVYSSFVVFCSCTKKTLFQQIESDHSNIHFNNKITETDSVTPFSHINIYNGGGVGTADFNNDGLQDIYFTGNMVANKLYLNKGDFKFEDITEAAGVNGAGRWCKGVSIVDINNDGRQDIYVSVAMDTDSLKRENLFYINLGNDKNGIPHFKERAAEYGLNDRSHSTMALFFDFDNDGDLDVYIVVNENILSENPSKFRPIKTNGLHPSTGRLYRNDWDAQLKHGRFVNVSKHAGITIEGFGHGGNICDINNDGWKDIYITNDFVSNNILYINNRDGTFTDQTRDYFKHTSTFSMGVDIQDINNDGLPDIVELDMNPEDNFRKKMMLGANNYQTFQSFDRYGYQYQYSRNTLQLNQGPRPGDNDSIGAPVFSEIGYLSGMSQTDWSWTPLVTDFDNDGYRDLVITNGYPRDVTDHDFMIYRAETRKLLPPLEALSQVPQVKLKNYAYKNNTDLSFRDVTREWGLNVESFSGGAAYADLDNDGDMDVIISNINDDAFIYKNNTTLKEPTANHFLNISFSGDSLNKDGLGAIVNIYYSNNEQQVYEHTPYRGYLSSVQNMAHFGLGKIILVDSLIVKWPGGKKQLIQSVQGDQLLHLDIANATGSSKDIDHHIACSTLFRDVTSEIGIHYQHKEPDFVDFNIQKLLPHKFSEYNPALAVGDVDGNGLDDIVCGGSSTSDAMLFLQQENSGFVEKKLLGNLSTPPMGDLSGSGRIYQDAGMLLFDADGDGDLDLYIASGGYEEKSGAPGYQDRFYVNDGRGNFELDKDALPENFTSKSCVRAADYDRDGDLDIFVAGRVDPWSYPKPVSSFIFRNDSGKSGVKFTDVTNTVANDLINIGLVCDAVFSDFDDDGWQDIILAGEWMPVTFLKNEKGIFKNITEKTGLVNHSGWWNSIAPADYDNDGDMDYVVGNLGLNSFFKATDKYPVYITAKDFDGNGSYDAFPSVFLPVSHTNPEKKEYSPHIRDDATNQVIGLRKKFINYKSYAWATFDDFFTPEERKDALRLQATMLSSAFVKNEGNGKFTISALPAMAQLSMLNGICVDDFNGDGNADVILNGNDFGTDVLVGRYDAFNGLLMLGDGKGHFKPQTLLQSGVFIPGNGKALVELRGNNEKILIAATQHNGPIKIFERKKSSSSIPLMPLDTKAVIKYRNGKTKKMELYYGYSFLSQSGRFVSWSEQVESISVVDSKGVARDIFPE